jgi:hypothetical protein
MSGKTEMARTLYEMVGMALAVMLGLGVVFWASLFYWSRSAKGIFMSETNSNKGGDRWSFTPPATFPDPATCRVKCSKLDDNVDCLNAWAWCCPHALQVEQGYLCRHPEKFDLLARTEAGPRD